MLGKEFTNTRTKKTDRERTESTKVFKDPWLPRPPSFLPITQGPNDELKVSDLIS